MTINEIMSLEEAAELWGKSTDSLRQACIVRHGKPPRFKIGVEARQSKRIWLVTHEGMKRLYGEPLGKEHTK
ncbi:helix-turn-helix domain-containing protein [Veillonella sp.]|uniref:helix-turn-helix domain-containing protein n=1 Tax=Veillonella sp. TaxID=1926307 RepID=UPI0025F99227|nr:helix-turn-helix domain-containing protein [Veillonella sp.]